MGKFRVGDKVRFVGVDGAIPKGGTYGAWHVGGEYMVSYCTSETLGVEADDTGGSNGWFARYFELAHTSPVRTVTRREIVPGGYGGVTLFSDMSACVSRMDANAAREAARIFNEIADVLDEQATEAKGAA